MRPYQTASKVQRSRRQYAARGVVFAEISTGGAGGHLDRLDGGAGRTVVYVVGPAPRDGWRAWQALGLPPGWVTEPSYFEGATPILRYAHEHGARVEIHHASEWFGGDADLADALNAWHVLTAATAEVFQGARLLATPATTGRDLARRMLPRGHEFPTLDDETQGLLRSTVGQARIEGPQTLLADELVERGGCDLPGLFEYDGRLMYAALCWSLPVGVPYWRDRPSLDEIDEYAHARYHVVARVPPTWPHRFGVLGVKEGRDGWRFPARPGERFDTWCDAAELRLAFRHGWSIDVVSSLTFPRTSAALRRWASALVDLRARCTVVGSEGDYSQRVVDLAQRAVRQMLLTAIGAFQGRPHRVTVEAPITDTPPPNMPFERVRIEGDRWQWYEDRPTRWPEFAHPEWCATIWGRGRARLLEGPAGDRAGHRLHAGCLHLAPGSRVVALRTDAIYVDRWQPWNDDGAPGRFRLVRFTHKPISAPRTATELLALRPQLDRAH